jgi:hypothetical protein
METDTALVRTDSRVKLHTVTTVDMYLAGIVHPRNSELNEAFGLNDAFYNAQSLQLRIRLDNRLEGFQNLGNSLNELGLSTVALFYGFHYGKKILIGKCHLHYLL